MTAYGGPDRILIERTPLHAKHLDLIGDVYPDAHVVHLIRDGRDVATSLVKQPWGPDSLEAAAAEWVETVGTARQSQPRLYHEVRHEDLRRDVAGELGRLFDSLGLSVSDQLLDRVRAVAPEPINRTPGNPSPGASNWQRQLTSQQVADVEGVAGPLLRELGYSTGEGRRNGTNRESSSASDGGPPRSGRWRRVRKGPVAKGGPADGSVAGEQIQYVIDQMLSRLESRDAVGLASLLSPIVDVRLHDTGRTMNGAAGVAEVATALIDAMAPSGKQVRGDVYPGSPSFTVVWSHDSDAGRDHRVFVVTVDRSGLIERLDCYQMFQNQDLVNAKGHRFDLTQS